MDAGTATHVQDAHVPLENAAHTPAGDTRPLPDLGQATLADVQAVGQSPTTADTVPLELHESAGGSGKAAGAGKGADAGSAKPADTPQAPESAVASINAADMQKQLEQARGAFGQAHTGDEQNRALKTFTDIITASDSNFQGLASAVVRTAEQISPGSSAAARDLSGAVERLVVETAALPPDKLDKMADDLRSWSSGDAKTQADVKQRLRDQGQGALADAMDGVTKVQHDYSSVFARGEQTEDQINSQFGQGLQDAMKVRVDARSDYRSALIMADKTTEADKVGREAEEIRADAAHISKIGD
jgi:hypothetical protein